MSVTIRALARDATDADDAVLATLEALGEMVFPGSGFSVREEHARPWGRVWLAEGLEGALGFLVAWHVADELHVLQVATTPALRRRGIGRALLREALDYAATRAIAVVVLEVRRSNHPALRLYRGAGFAITGLRRGYYDDTGEDAVEMLLRLDPRTGLVLAEPDDPRARDVDLGPQAV